TIRSNFAEMGGETKLLLTGPAVFATDSRTTIEAEAWRLSMAAALLVVLILFCVYRHALPVLLTALPVFSGLIIGIAAVALGFGVLHGLTLGFGATLIGEAVDYPSYVFTHAARGELLAQTLSRIWPTLRLAVLTTVFGALAMLLSSFTGLSQLGLLTVSGVIVAGLTTRFVLPAIAPRVTVSARVVPARAFAVLAVLKRGAFLLWILVLASFAVLAFNHERIWDDDIANLSPISPAAKRLDQQLRAELGAPDVRYLLVIAGASKQEVLRLSEQKVSWINQLVENGVISGYELAARILPSMETQEARRAALPDSEELRRNVMAAAEGLPFRDGLFAPFIEDVARAKKGALIDEASLQDSPLALKVDSLLFAAKDRWFALVPLTGVADAQALARAADQQNDIRLLDLKSEAIELIASYRSESLSTTVVGMTAIVAVLAVGLGSIRGAARVLTPVFAAVVIDLGALVLLGQRLTLFHLVSLLLVVGIGLNYSLFFNRPPRDDEDRRRTLTSLLVCSLTTISAFGCLAFSTTPVLHAIGVTVALGALLSLLGAAVLQD
ncbi:MAG: MMPL family transporter, partial [Burkholderiales bacterium]